MNFISRIMILLALMACFGCGVKTDMRPVNQKQEVIGMDKYRTYKDRNYDRSIIK